MNAVPVNIPYSPTPPGGWRYGQPESGYWMESHSLSALLSMIESHRRANGYDLSEGWQDVVKLQLCVDLDLDCRPDTTATPEKEDGIKAVDLLRFFRTIREWTVKHRLKLVSQEEADRRAAICAGCPLNDEVPGCHGCQGTLRWVTEFLGKHHERTTEVDDQLKSCSVCKCLLKLKIHLPREAIDAASSGEDLDFPDHCWLSDAAT